MAGNDSVDILRLRCILESVDVGIILVDERGKILFANAKARSLTGCENLENSNLREALNVSSTEEGLDRQSILEGLLDAGQSKQYNNLLLQTNDGVVRYVSVSARAAGPREDAAFGITLTLRDVTEEKKREDEFLYLSYHDKLTGLYNRTYFEKVIKEVDKPENLPISIMIGDVNGLKISNDVFGHHQGDKLLVTIANILCIACRETDIVARTGGDEFIVLMPRTSYQQVSTVYARINDLSRIGADGGSKISISLGFATKTSEKENLKDVLRTAEDAMYRHKLLESKSYRNSVISSLKETLFERSCETEEHAIRLAKNCLAVGRALGLPQNELNDLEVFAMLHDIGKIAVSESILRKPGILTPLEWEQVKKHCEVGYRIAQSAPEISNIAEYILCHHERWDGRGYPQGLSGKDIPLLSRILSVADAYDAMVNYRCYRKAVSKQEAIEELRRCAGAQFDAAIVETFIGVVG